MPLRAARLLALVLTVLAVIASLLSPASAAVVQTLETTDPPPTEPPAATSLIQGLVRDGGNGDALVDGVAVEAVPADDPEADPVASALTYEARDDLGQDHGAYQLHVPAGDYLVRFLSPDYDTRQPFDTKYYGGLGGDVVTVSDQEVLTLDDVTLQRSTGRSVTGTVTAGGSPVENADVSLWYFSRRSGEWTIDWTETDESGAYTFGSVYAGRSYTVQAADYQSDTVRTFLGGGLLTSEARTFSPDAGDGPIALGAIELHPSVEARVQIVDAGTGSMLDNADADVLLSGADGALDYFYGGGQSYYGDSDLGLRVPRGRAFTVQAYGYGRPRYEAAYLGDTTDAAAARRVTLNQDGDLGALALRRSATTATGSVVDGDGQPIGGADVEIFEVEEAEDGWSGMWSVDTISTDDAGEWSSQSTFPGSTYVVKVSAPDQGLGEAYVGGGEDQTSAAQHTQPATGVMDLGETTLSALGTSIVGRVAVSEEIPSADGQACVQLYELLGRDTPATDDDAVVPTAFQITDGGRYSFLDVDPGSYAVQAGWCDSYGDRDCYRDWEGSPYGTEWYQPTWIGGATPDEAAFAPIDVTSESGRLRQPMTTLEVGRVISGHVTSTVAGGYRLGFVYPSAWDDSDDSVRTISGAILPDGSYATAVSEDGDYTLTAETYRGPSNREVPTWLGGEVYRPRVKTAANTVTVEGPGNSTGHDIVMQQGVLLSGRLLNEDGRGVDGGVTARRTDAENPGQFDYGQSWYGYVLGNDRTYTVAVPRGTSVGVQAYGYRRGYGSGFYGREAGEQWFSPDTAELVSTDSDKSGLDITIPSDWSFLHGTAVEQDSLCLAQEAYDSTSFAGRELWLDGGLISDDVYSGWRDSHRPELATDDSLADVIAPWMTTRRLRYGSMQATHGVSEDGSRLCALFSSYDYRTNRENLYQVILETQPGTDALKATINYDKLGWGFRNGRTLAFLNDGKTVQQLTGDPSETSTGSEVPGRHVFQFAGFDSDRDAELFSSEYVRMPEPAIGVETTTNNSGDEGVTTWWLTGRRGAFDLVGTGPSYTPTSGDAGKRLWARSQREDGTETLVYGLTRGRRVQAEPAAANETAPSVVAPEKVESGAVLTVEPGAWSPAEGLMQDDLVFTYQWLVNGRRVSGADGTSFTIRDRDGGSDVSVIETVGADGYTSISERSSSVRVPVPPAMPTLSGSVSISGDAVAGQTLTAVPGAWSAEPDAYAYTWYVGGREVAGKTLDLTADDAGRYVDLTVTATKTGYRSGSAHAWVGPVTSEPVKSGTLAATVTRPQGSTDKLEWIACPTTEVLSCAYGTVAFDEQGDGSFTSSSLLAKEDGTEYSVQVHPAWNAATQSDLLESTHLVTIKPGATTALTVAMEKATPPPANVSVPTSSGTYSGLPTVYYGEPQTIKVTGCPAVAEPKYTVTFEDGTSTTGPMTETAGSGASTYAATIPAFYPQHGVATIATNVPVDCDKPEETTSFKVYIDPSGVVTDQYGRPIGGAEATLLRSETATGSYAVVPDGSDIMSPQNRENPMTTDDGGNFRWDVEEGFYKVRVAAQGCVTRTTKTYPVPPPAIDLLVKLTCTSPAPAPSVAISGTPKAGEMLTTAAPAWPGEIKQISTQWLRDGQPIDGATGLTYTVSEADQGSALSVRHTGQRPAYTEEEGRGDTVTFAQASVGSATMAVQKPADPGTGGGTGGNTGGGTGGNTGGDTGGNTGGGTESPGPDPTPDPEPTPDPDPTPDPEPQAPTSTTAPRISGLPRPGVTILGLGGSWAEEGVESAYQWLRDGSPIDGATSAAYRVRPADVGSVLTFQETGSLGGAATAVVSEAVTPARYAAQAYAKPASKIVGRGKAVRVLMLVRSEGGRAVGPVAVYEKLRKGERPRFVQLTEARLRARQDGKRSVLVRGLSSGRHRLVVVFRGNPSVERAIAKPFVVRVKRR